MIDLTSTGRCPEGLLAIAQRVMALPGVRSVGFSEGMPLFHRTTVEFRPPARPDALRCE